MSTALVFGTGLAVGVIATGLLVLYLDRILFRKMDALIDHQARLIRQLVSDLHQLIAERDAEGEEWKRV